MLCISPSINIGAVFNYMKYDIAQFDLEFKVTVMLGTTEMESTWIIWFRINIADEMVPQSCFDLTFDTDYAKYGRIF